MPVTDLFAHLEARLRGGRNQYRNRVFVSGLIRTITVAGAVLLVALVAGALLSSFPRWYGPLAVGVALTLVAATVHFLFIPLFKSPGVSSYARLVERRVPTVRSLLVNALELAPVVAKRERLRGGASRELAAALIVQAEKKSRGIEFQRLAPRAIPHGWGRALLLVMAGWIAGFLFAPDALLESGWGLLHPKAAIAKGVSFEVWPGDVRVAPGSDVHIEVRVKGSNERPDLHVRIAGEGQQLAMLAGEAPTTGTETAEERQGVPYQARIDAVSAPALYRVEVAGQSSPLYRIELTGAAAPVSFDLTYHYPEYTGRPSEVQSVPRADLIALRGTRVTVGVNLDRQVDDVRWSFDSEFQQQGSRRWEASTTIEGNGQYEIVIETDGRTETMSFRFQEVADRPPVLTVLDPLGDLELPVGQRVPLRVAATDDFGLTDLRIVYRIDGEPAQRKTLTSWGHEPKEATAGKVWDLSPLGLLPGQRVTFHFEVRDNDRISGPKVTESGRYVVRFPTLSEIYEEVEERQEDAVSQLEEVTEKARELAQQVEETRRELEQPNQMGQEGATWEQRQQARELADRQQNIAERMQEIADQFEEVTQQAAEREAFREEILAKMEEISKLMRELESPELRKAMEELRRSLEESNPKGLENQLRELEMNQEQLLKSLERTMELLERVRQEERLEAAARRAEELARRQEAFNQQMESTESSEDQDRLSAAEEQAAQETEDLQKELEKLSQDLEENGQNEASEQTSEAQNDLQQQALPSMQQAAEQLRQGQKGKAGKSGKQAEQSLSQVAQNLRQAAESMSQQIDQEQVEAVRRAAQDLVNLSQRQEQALQQGGDTRERARREQDLREGAEGVADDLFEVAKKTPFLSEDAAQSLGEALRRLESSADAFDRGVPLEGERQGQEASNSLNEAVLALRDAEQSMCEGGAQPGEKSGREQLQQMVGQQSQLNRETRSMAQKLAEQQRMMSQDSDALEQLAARQDAIRRGIEDALKNQEQGQILGRLDDTKKDMEEVARELSRKQLDDQVLERQQRILSRLLDAQRSVNQREFEERRESRSGESVARESPAQLPRELLQPDARMNHDLLRARSERYSPEYRDLVESYLRRLQEER